MFPAPGICRCRSSPRVFTTRAAVSGVAADTREAKNNSAAWARRFIGFKGGLLMMSHRVQMDIIPDGIRLINDPAIARTKLEFSLVLLVKPGACLIPSPPCAGSPRL